eukprot:721914-Pyramimonas_sp.AAC.1
MLARTVGSRLPLATCGHKPQLEHRGRRALGVGCPRRKSAAEQALKFPQKGLNGQVRGSTEPRHVRGAS